MNEQCKGNSNLRIKYRSTNTAVFHDFKIALIVRKVGFSAVRSFDSAIVIKSMDLLIFAHENVYSNHNVYLIVLSAYKPKITN